MKRTIVLMLGIILVAVGLRFYKLGTVPVSPDWDEVALGYNAYSILKTGRDEYGNFLPLSIRSYNDYKPPLYVYLTVPSVGIFGLSVWSTRLPSAVMGVLAVVGVFFLVRELLRKFRFSNQISLVSSLLLAISPWHIQFSRIAFEANTGVTVNICAVAAFLTGLRRRIFLVISAALFAIGMYAYHSERIFLPLLLVLLIIVYRKQLFVQQNKKYIIGACITGILIAAPLVPVLLSSSAMFRLQGTSSFTDQTKLLARDVLKLQDDTRAGNKIGSLLDNRRIVWIKTLASGYFSHFSFRWLFLTGDNPRHHAPDMGLLYLWELPFLLYGMYYSLKFFRGPVRTILFGWLLLSPVAASPTTGLPHAVRTLVFLPSFQIFTAVGLVGAIQNVKNILSRQGNWLTYVIYGIVCVYSVFLIGNIAYYLDMYFVQTNPEVSEYWQYGYKDTVAYTESHKAQYQSIVVSTKLEQSYMFFLFYTGYDPKKYLAHGGTISGRTAFDTYVFRTIDWLVELRDGSILYVMSPSEITHGNVMNVKFLDGTPAIILADRVSGTK
jgi:4-amino-4-deoxy-L-arabinose transferase-like glycosyltransferase